MKKWGERTWKNSKEEEKRRKYAEQEDWNTIAGIAVRKARETRCPGVGYGAEGSVSAASSLLTVRYCHCIRRSSRNASHHRWICCWRWVPPNLFFLRKIKKEVVVKKDSKNKSSTGIITRIISILFLSSLYYIMPMCVRACVQLERATFSVVSSNVVNTGRGFSREKRSKKAAFPRLFATPASYSHDLLARM